MHNRKFCLLEARNILKDYIRKIFNNQFKQ